MKTLGVRLPEETIKILEATAKKYKVSLTEVVRSALEELTGTARDRMYKLLDRAKFTQEQTTELQAQLERAEELVNEQKRLFAEYREEYINMSALNATYKGGVEREKKVFQGEKNPDLVIELPEKK